MGGTQVLGSTLAADGLTTDHHFTVDNSPSSNDIQDIAMDYGSGEVYIGTSVGLSYAGGDNWDRDMEDVRVMPNPIRADHTGPIVIDGLTSTVHITDARGTALPSFAATATAPPGTASRQQPTRLTACVWPCHRPKRQEEPWSNLPSSDEHLARACRAPNASRGHHHFHGDVGTRRMWRPQHAQGFPDLPTPPALRSAVAEALEAGHNQYAPMPGNPALRRWIADVYHRGAGYNANTEIAIGAGASGAFAAMTALLHPGDEVVVQDPCYDLYAPVAELNHATVALLDAEGQ